MGEGVTGWHTCALKLLLDVSGTAEPGGLGGFSPPPPLLRRMTFYFVFVCGTCKEIKKRRTRKRKNSLQVILPKRVGIPEAQVGDWREKLYRACVCVVVFSHR